jgi:4-hydroxybenzoate polyprenyltransferase
MISFLKLVRVQNLLIIAFTQYVVRWCIVYPILKAKELELQLSDFNFFLLVLSTVIIAAAGYTINDYFDVKIDKVNKPNRLIIDKGIKRRIAMGAHTVMNIVAVLIALYVSYTIGNLKIAFIHFFCATGLWFYSTNFKRQFLIGNLVIAAFTSLVPLIVGIYELLPCYKTYLPIYPHMSLRIIWLHILGVSFFAFVTTLIREIIKDIEDVDGDKEFGCNTMPVVIGKNASKIIAVIITIFTMSCLCYFQIFQWKNKDWLSFYYFMIALQLPFAFLIFKIITANTSAKYHTAGNISKLIMLLGVCYLFLFAYSLLSYIHTIHAV